MRYFLSLFATGLLLALVALPAASATPSAPTAVTGSASAVTEKTASLGGTVTPNGAPTTYWFEYGSSTSYGSQTATRHAGAGLGSESVAANLSGLTPGTLYHFRLDASNASGTTDGADATFTTASAPAPVVTTGAASGVTEKTAMLGGSLTPNGAPTTYWFEYGSSTSYGSQTATRHAGAGLGSESVAANLSGLTPGTLYHFRLDASNASGTTDGADATFTTASAPAPVVTTGAASGVTEKTAMLGGSLTPNGAPTTYWFEYGSSTSYGSQTATRHAGAGLGSESVAANLSGLTPGTLYHFRLDASNASGTTDGADATFTTASAPAPVVSTGAPTAVTEKTATLAGTVGANGEPTTYWFEYGTSTSYGSQTATRNAGAGLGSRSVGANLWQLTPGTQYHYRLDATNASGTTDGADQTFTTLPATVLPHRQWFAGSVSAVGSDTLTVGVSWTGPHDGSLNGQTVTVAIDTATRINEGPHHTPIALGQIEPNQLVSLDTVGNGSADLTALRVHVSCDCHWVGGTISSLDQSGNSLTVQVTHTGPYDGVLDGQNVTIQVNDDTVYMRGPHRGRIAFSDLKIGDGVGIIFAANGFFAAPGFNPATATFTATRVHVWGRNQVPPVSSDADGAAQTSVSG